MAYGNIIRRDASDSFYAFKVAEAIQSLDGADVFSMVFLPSPQVEIIATNCYEIWAKYDPARCSPDAIDEAITAAYDGLS